MKRFKRIINALHFAVMVSYNGKSRNGLTIGWKLAKIIELGRGKDEMFFIHIR